MYLLEVMVADMHSILDDYIDDNWMHAMNELGHNGIHRMYCCQLSKCIPFGHHWVLSVLHVHSGQSPHHTYNSLGMAPQTIWLKTYNLPVDSEDDE